MTRIVQKFGGTSVADPARIKAVAAIVKRELDAGSEVAVVLSAMAGITDQLAGYVTEAGHNGNNHDSPEYDAVVSTGEQVTAGLLALSLREIGVAARSWLGWQIPIRTDATPISTTLRPLKGSTDRGSRSKCRHR